MTIGFIKDEINKSGISVAHFVCVVCKEPYTVTPSPAPENRNNWSACLSEFCGSYDPERDAEIMFMTPAEIMNSATKVVSIVKLGERKRFLEASDL